jgi:hypothetical protein
MPDFMTHSLFAADSLKLLPEDRKLQLDKFIPLITLGAQGPDPFFYFGKQPLRDSKGYPKLAGKLHTRRTDEFLAQLWGFVKEGEEDTAERFAYAWGFTGHYALDTQCHPYVYAQAGYAFNGGQKTREMTANHVLLEADIDALIYNRKTGRDIKKLKLWELTPDTVPKFMDGFYKDVLRIYDYPGYHTGDFERAMKDMKLAQRFLYDPHGLKENMNRLLSRIKGRSVYLGKPVYPSLEHIADLDCMNESHEDWFNPMDEAVVYKDSFLDLYEQAHERMGNYLEHIELFLGGGCEADELFEGYSYDTRLRWDSEENKKMVSGPGLMQGRL